MGQIPRGLCEVLFSLSSEMLKITDLCENYSSLTPTPTSGCVENVGVGLFKGSFLILSQQMSRLKCAFRQGVSEERAELHIPPSIQELAFKEDVKNSNCCILLLGRGPLSSENPGVSAHLGVVQGCAQGCPGQHEQQWP